VAYWLDHKGDGTLLIALTDCALAWDNVARDFAAGDGARLPLPPALATRRMSGHEQRLLRQLRAQRQGGLCYCRYVKSP
jgi:hypothetical protein